MDGESSNIVSVNIYYKVKHKNPTGSQAAVQAFPYIEDLSQTYNPTDLFRGYLGFLLCTLQKNCET